MVHNYVKAAFRNLWMHKGYSFINIAGLSIGLASSFIIVLYAVNGLAYDRFNKNFKNIYLVVSEIPGTHLMDPNAPHILGPTLKDEYPDVQEVARCHSAICPIKYKGNDIERALCVSSDPAIFKILTFPFVSGSLQALSTERNYAVLSNEMAQRIFGAANPLGGSITINWRGESYTLRVCAVMKDLPRTSTFSADIFVPMFIGEKDMQMVWSKVENAPQVSWRVKLVYTYVLLSSPHTADEIERKMEAFSKSHFDPKQGYLFHLFPLKDIYLQSSGFINSHFPAVDITTLRVYPTIALLTLLIACANLVILNTGRVGVRTKEIAVRKVMGARRIDLMKQFMLESILISALSLPIALLLVELFFPTMSNLLGETLSGSDFHSVDYLLVLAGITLMAGVVAGSYVSFYLSSFRPIEILTHRFTTGGSKGTFRKIMVGTQMMIFIGLITASITIHKQVSYFHSIDMGFDKESLLVLTPQNRNLGAGFETFKTELKNEPSIMSVTGASNLPGTDAGNFTEVRDKSEASRKVYCQLLSVDRDFIETMKMRMISGKSFAEATPEEAKNACIINEAGVEAFGIADFTRELINGKRILGVVKDFNARSLREEITPTVITCSQQLIGEIAVRLRRDADFRKMVSFIERKSMAFNNGKPMRYEFFDERLNNLYSSDYRFAKMIGYFTALAIFVACLGLFGVSLFVIQMRVKEIGIRKVMGASVGSILYLVSKEFLVLTLASAVIAIPMSIQFINRWLQNYAYRVTVDFWVVAYAVLSATIIVLAVMGYQAIWAARANPVDALRCE